MMVILSHGKWRGLKTSSTTNHGLPILAFDQREHDLQETVIPRMVTLRDIVERDARPWKYYYQPQPAIEGWYVDYAPQRNDDD